MSISTISQPIYKETRALALPWLACLSVMILPALFDAPLYIGFAVPAYFLGTAALGALSVGHEYSYRTLSLLLSLPVRRERLFAAKLGVLAAMLLALWAVAYTMVFGDSRLPRLPKMVTSVVPVLYGLGLAPFLTMACRSAIAGAVFTIAIPGIMFVTGELLGTKLYGHGSVMEAFRLAFVWSGMLGLSIIGFVCSWWMFLRFEAVEGRAEHVSLPQWAQPTSSARLESCVPRRGHPMWLLVKKEIRLQHLAIAIAGLHSFTWVIASWLMPVASNARSWSLLASATTLYAGMISLVIGASASAGERDLATLEWQLLQPVAASKQWVIKLVVVFAMSLALAVGLPATLLHLTGLASVSGTFGAVQPDRPMIVASLLLTTAGVYVSSVCGSALWALVMSLPAMIASVAFFQIALPRIGAPVYFATLRPAMRLLPAGINANYLMLLDRLGLALVIAFIAFVLRIAFANHRTVDRPLRRISMQLLVIAVFAVGARIVLSVAAGVLAALYRLQLPPQFR